MSHPTRIFQNEDELYTAFEGYKEDLTEQANEWVKVQYVGKHGDRVKDPQKLPQTIEGFERYCRRHHGCVHQYFDNKQGYYADFVAVCARIKSEIRENQILGGMLGFFNPSITQRLNGLRDAVDVKSEDTKTIKVSFKD